MSQQRKQLRWAAGLFVVVIGMALLAEGEAEDQQRSVLVYCEGVAVFEAEKARGVPLENRVGHYDWDDNIDVAEQCPGMRPAGPAIDEYQAPARLAMPDTAPFQQYVQF